MATLLETLAANETAQSPAMERFIETLTALVLQCEEEVEAGPAGSPRGVLKYLMEERRLRQVDLRRSLGAGRICFRHCPGTGRSAGKRR